MERLLAITLFIGGTLVGAVILWLMNLYARDGRLAPAVAIIGAILGLLLFVCPQWVVGWYLLKAGKADDG